MYRIGNILLFIAIMVLTSCDTEEEFPVNSSSFLRVQGDNTTIIYEGKKAGDFVETAEQIDWNGITKLIVKGHINNKDVMGIRRYISPAFNGPLRKLDFKDAELFEGQFINQPFNNLGKNLEYFVYPKKMKATGYFVTDNSNWVREIIIPEDVEILGDRLFESVSIRHYLVNGNYQPVNLPYMAKEKYAIPPTVKELGIRAYAFYPYETLEIPESVERIKEYCFMNSKITSLKIPSKVTSIPAYMGAPVKNIELPDGLTSIGDYALTSNKLEELILPDNVSFLGYGFISGTTSLKANKIHWPKNLTELGERVMEGTQFEEFYIPQQYTSIGRSCFYKSTIKRLWFHKNITQLGYGFINGMPDLEEVHVAWTTPPNVDKLFENVVISPLGNVINKSPDFAKVKLYVPQGTAQAYKKAEGWKKFQQIIEE